MKKIGLLYFAFFILISSFGQTEELNYYSKYQHYRINLRNKFMYYTGDASTAGAHLPMECIRYNNAGKKVGYWADGIWWQGHYISLLALEYKVLTLKHKDTQETLQELKWALETYLRLDQSAESCWNGQDTLNGFFLRDDVSKQTADLYDVDYIASDYGYYCHQDSAIGNAPSQDQLWASYIGFALVMKLVDDTAIVHLAQDIVYRSIKAMQHQDVKRDKWEIINPVNGMLIQKEGDIKWLKYAHAQAGFILSGKDLHFANSDKGISKDIWKILMNNLLIDRYGHFNWYGVMCCSIVLNDWGSYSNCNYEWLIKRCRQIAKRRPDLQQSLIFPHLPLISVIINGYEGDKLIDKSYYEAYFESAPIDGAFHLITDGIDSTSQAPWHSLSLFCPWHTKAIGEFNMIDYMVLYNAYRLVYGSFKEN